MTGILSLSGTSQGRLIRDGAISSVDLVELHLKRIAEVNPSINAAIEVLAEPARQGARIADQRRADDRDQWPQ